MNATSILLSVRIIAWREDCPARGTPGRSGQEKDATGHFPKGLWINAVAAARSAARRWLRLCRVVKRVVLFGALLCCAVTLHGKTVFEASSPYHQVQVVDEGGMRMLSFNGTRESRMSLTDPLQGQFEYTEYFHTPWVWNREIRRVLMIGLGGGSIQKAYQHYYTNVICETVEIDPIVVKVAKEYFKVQETPALKIRPQDGRVFLNRTSDKYDVILMDAYTSGRYGSSVPPHLTTREFFALASVHLTTNGVLAYNVMGQMQGSRTDFIGAMYRTMKEIFPQVYAFPAESSMNVVLVATMSSTRFDNERVQREGAELVQNGKVKVPGFAKRLRVFESAPPAGAAKSPVLTDDRAPVESLLNGSDKSR